MTHVLLKVLLISNQYLSIDIGNISYIWDLSYPGSSKQLGRHFEQSDEFEY